MVTLSLPLNSQAICNAAIQGVVAGCKLNGDNHLVGRRRSGQGRIPRYLASCAISRLTYAPAVGGHGRRSVRTKRLNVGSRTV